MYYIVSATNFASTNWKVLDNWYHE